MIKVFQIVSAILLGVGFGLFIIGDEIPAIYFLIMHIAADFKIWQLIKSKKPEIQPLEEPELLKRLAETNSEMLKSYQRLHTEMHRQSRFYASTVERVDRKINGQEKIKFHYDLEADIKQAFEFDRNLSSALMKIEQLNQAMLDTEIIKGIIKRGHETFYKNKANEYWSQPHGLGGYCIFKKGQFYDQDNQPPENQKD